MKTLVKVIIILALICAFGACSSHKENRMRPDIGYVQEPKDLLKTTRARLPPQLFYTYVSSARRPQSFLPFKIVYHLKHLIGGLNSLAVNFVRSLPDN